MDAAQAQAFTVPLTAAELDQVQRAAAVAGQSIDDFMRTAVLRAANDPFIAALEQAADTIAARDRIQYDYATRPSPAPETSSSASSTRPTLTTGTWCAASRQRRSWASTYRRPHSLY
ncbi:hypothetical protein ABZ865_41410 [Streptomyces sp. NPDC047085]|uniref:hypothetical protein n=1 Tax=Streptomyces sp. NPDC047085 TaxID=3155140 RepID=UPI0033E07C66